MIIFTDDDHAGCGVFAHVGLSEDNGGFNLSDLLYTALKELEYRGYQSAGFVNFGIGEQGEAVPDRFRNLGGADNIKPYLDAHPPKGTLQLAHVRWPTTSPATRPNAHPQRVLLREKKGRLYLVFNGDIHNYRELDKWLADRYQEELKQLIADGVPRRDAEDALQDLLRPADVGTDAWTFAAMLMYFYDPEKGIMDAVRKAYPLLDGYFAMTCACELEPGRIIGAVKGNMPLLLGIGKDEATGNFLASEPGAFVRHTSQAVSLQSGDIVSFTKGGYELYAIDASPEARVTKLSEKERPVQILTPEEYIYTLHPHYRCFMEQEIFYQPAALAQTIHGYLPVIKLSPEEERMPTSERERLIRERRMTIAHDLIEGKKVPPSPFDENRIDVLEAILDGKDARFDSINLSDEEIRTFRRILGVASGTSGYALMGMMPSFQSTTGLRDDVLTGTKKFDEVRKELRIILEAVFAAVNTGELRQVFLDFFEPGSDFRAGHFPSVVEAKHLVELIKALKKTVADKRFAHIPELNVFTIRLQESEETLGIAVSQSGGTIDTNDVVQIYQTMGVKFIGIVNKPGESPLVEKTKNDGGVFRTYANTEKGVASTKAHTAQAAVVEELALYFGLIRNTISKERAREKLEALRAIPHLAQAYLENEGAIKQIREIAEELKSQRYVFFGGRSGLIGTAKEAALKLKEISYIGTEAEDLGEFKHGWRALFPNTADPRLRTYAICFLADRATHKESVHNVSEIKGSAGTTIVIDFEGLAQGADVLSDHLIQIPQTTDDLAPILSIIPAQLLAYYTTVVIDEVAHKVRPLVHELYFISKGDRQDRFHLEERALRKLSDRLTVLGAQGDLGQLTVDKVDEIKHHIREALASQSHVDRDIHVANLIREMASEHLSMVLFFEDMLRNFSEDLDEVDAQVITETFHQARQDFTDADERLKFLFEKLSIILSQGAERGHRFLASCFKSWNERMGIVWFLERDPDQPRNLAKVVTVK